MTMPFALRPMYNAMQIIRHRYPLQMNSIEEYKALIIKGAAHWNTWRKKNPTIYPILDGIELIDLNLEKIDFSGVSFCNAVINRCKLTSSSFISARIYAASFQGNDFTSARMIAAELVESDFSDSIFDNTNILTASIRGSHFDRVDFSGHDLQGFDLRDTSFKEAKLNNQIFTRTDFSGANLDNCQLNNSDLTHAKLSGVSCTGVNFRSTVIKGADFFQADLTKCNFAGTNIEDVNFKASKLIDCDFRKAKIKHSSFMKADITGGFFWEVDAVDWTLTKVKCNHAFWDKRGKQKTYYSNYEFERLYSHALTIELNYPFRLSGTEISTLPILIEHLRASQWGTSIRLKSIQDYAGGSCVILSIDESSSYDPSDLRDQLQKEALSIQLAQIAIRQDNVLQQQLKEGLAHIKDRFWPRLLELASESEREQTRKLTIIFMDLKGFSQWKDEELNQKLTLFRGLVKPILKRWNAGHPNMEGDSLRITFKNATIAIACADMLLNVLTSAGFELRIGIDTGEVSVVHNVVTNQPDIEGAAVSMAARLEAAGNVGEVLVTDRVKYYSDHRGFFEFTTRRVQLKKSIANKKQGDIFECYAVKVKEPVLDVE